MEGESCPRQPSNLLVLELPWCRRTSVLLDEIHPHLPAPLLLARALWTQPPRQGPCCLHKLRALPAGRLCCFGACNAALAPLQSFEEPRCDLRENLLRYGCGEASIIYTRGEMRTEQVGAGRHWWLSSSRGGLRHPQPPSYRISRRENARSRPFFFFFM